MTKKKLLWSGDCGAKTGFSRVTEGLLPYLSKEYEVIVLANNWWGDPHPLQKDYVMIPSSNRFQQEPFGVQRIREIVENVKPDVVLVMNDAWITNQLYQQIKDLHEAGNFKFIAYQPMDSYGWTGVLSDFANAYDARICYTEFGAKEWANSGMTEPIDVIPHGVDLSAFFPIDKKAARQQLGIDENAFIVFNGNRNQHRKRQDITIDGFAQFAARHPEDENIKLYMHCGLKDQGWDIMPLFGRTMYKYGVTPHHRIIMTHNNTAPPQVSVEMLNVIYNAADVGINTCKGEGWGLVNFEHAACGVAQVVPNHTSCKEIFEGHAPLIRTAFDDIDMNLNRIMPCPDAGHLADILDSLYMRPDYRAKVAQSCYARAREEQFGWEAISSQFCGVIHRVLNKEPVEMVEEAPKRKERKPRRRKSKATTATTA